MNAEQKTLYVFIDESGDFVFSNKGTKHFILTAISCINPLRGRDAIISARYELLKEGVDVEYFHATEDAQVVRDKFYSKIKTLTEYEIDSVIAEKRKANTALYNEITIDTKAKGLKLKRTNVEEKFYRQICETLIQYIMHRFVNIRRHLGINKVVVVLDQCVSKNKREFVTKYIKTYMSDKFGLVPYVYFHLTKVDVNSQIADYCCWAIKKKWSDNELRPYNEISQNLQSEFEIFKNGKTFFY